MHAAPEDLAPDSSELINQTPLSAARVEQLATAVHEHGPEEAGALLAGEPPELVADVLARVIPSEAVELLWKASPEWREHVLAAAPADRRAQWIRNHDSPDGTIGRLMDHAVAVFAPELTVDEAVKRLRELVRHALITYGYVVDAERRLVGVLIFRDLLFADRSARLGEVMLRDPFALRADMPVAEAMQAVVTRHFPEYPVCDDDGHLVGLVRGQTLFAEHAFELSAMPGTMVGVEKEERLTTAWQRSLRFRHPWLQLNLLTAFLAAGVVGAFQDTIDRLVVLAVFLPVLAGQSGNTGSQALAVALRGMTLGELTDGKGRRLVSKEALLGVLNGALIGLTAGIGMYVYARSEGNDQAPLLAAVVFLAMVASCAVSGVAGAIVPMTLRRLGVDPATSSGIFLTTATDVVSMGLFLGLATWLVL
jgi:magnesium transporter